MAHEIYTLNGKSSMAYAGQVPWHGLGQSLSPGAPIETWIKEAGMEWQIEEAPVLYLDKEDEAHAASGYKVLYRSDNGSDLSIVSAGYQVVQPAEVIEFFRDLVEAGNMTLETAGTLRGGKIQWALARIGKDMNIQGIDALNMYALLATSCDKSMASTGRLTSVRVVCKNTMDMAYGRGLNIAKVSHKAEFDDAKKDEVKKQMGLIHEDIEEQEKQVEAMAKAPLKKEDAVGFFLSLLAKKDEKGKLDFGDVSVKKLNDLYTAYKSSPGSDLSTAKDTLWGAVNAVTYSVDHNPDSRSSETRLNNAWFGQGRALKAQAYSQAVEVVEERTNASILDAILEATVEKNIVEDLLKGIR